MQKIWPLAELKGIRGVLAHGCFDILHVGHIRFLRWGRDLLPAAPLIVTVTADRFFPTKGDDRPVYPEHVRAECVAALECVDFVAIVHERTGLLAIETIKPHIYVKGLGDLTLNDERDAVIRLGGRVEQMSKEKDSDGNVYSSTRVLRRMANA